MVFEFIDVISVQWFFLGFFFSKGHLCHNFVAVMPVDNMSCKHCSFSKHNFLQRKVTHYLLAKTAAIQQLPFHGLPRDVTLRMAK